MYKLEIKRSARKELEDLSDDLLLKIDKAYFH
jgi:mRNA-degrading endonuclease RelE of RelBE toxin-antitoxin system